LAFEKAAADNWRRTLGELRGVTGGTERAEGLAGPGVRVLLAGTGAHRPGSALAPIAAVAPTLAEIQRVLVERCGVDPAGVQTVLDPAGPMVLGAALAEAAARARDVLVFYYVGHGLVAADGELHLATLSTDDEHRGLAYKALPFAAVREAVRGCPARARVIVLDCCFAGRAGGRAGGRDDGFSAAQVRGTYLLAAAAHDEQGLAPAGEEWTAFSGALAGLLREGDPRGPRWLTLGHVYRYLARALPARGVPRPRRYADGLADDLILARNPAYLEPAGAPSPQPVTDTDAGGPGDAPGSGEQHSPYQGLDAFAPEDARFYFGRERLTAELAEMLADAATTRPGPVLIVGASGCGKSSLLRAGLVPAFERGAVPVAGSPAWPQVVFTPGSAPLERLAAALSPAASTPVTSGMLREDPARLAAVLRGILAGRPEGGRVVLLVDQFEELFAQCPDEEERRAFIEALGAACGTAAHPDGNDRDEAPPGLVALALRADFYGRCLGYPVLAQALRDRQVLVGPMTGPELRQVIEKPAEAAGLGVQPGLADLLLRDLRGGAARQEDAGTLPLLSYALLATWQRRDGGVLTMAGYQAAGGIWDAVAQKAEELYARLEPSGQAAARAILLAMVRIGEGAEDTRRLAGLDELMSRGFAGEETAFTAARDELAAARLITLGSGGATITHEALLRAWPRLRSWIAQDRVGLLLHQQLSDAAATWQRAGRDNAALYRGSLLAAARAWAAGRKDELAALEREFLDASASLEQAEHRAARRRARRWRAAAAALCVLTCLALILAFIADSAYRSANTSRLNAESRQFAAEEAALGGADPAQAALLALAGWQAARTEQARTSLLSDQAASYQGTLTRTSTQTVAISPDGQLIATAGFSDQTVRLWDARTRRQLAAFHVGGRAYSLTFSPDGQTLAAAVANARHGVWLWNVASRRLTRNLPGGATAAVAFSPDGRLLAAAQAAGVALYDPATGTQAALLSSGPNALAESLAFSPDGRLLAAGAEAGIAPAQHNVTDVWNVAARSLIASLPARGAGWRPVAFSPDGRLLASGGVSGEVSIWDAVTHRVLAPLPDTEEVERLAFTPDSDELITAGSSALIRSWGVTTHALVSSYNAGAGAQELGQALAVSKDGHTMIVGGRSGVIVLRFHQQALLTPGPLSGVAFSPGGQFIATAGADGAVRIWDNATRWQLRVLPANQRAQAVAFSRDGLLAAAYRGGRIRLWNPATGRQLAVLPTLGAFALGVAFSPDGTDVAAYSASVPASAALVGATPGTTSRRLAQGARDGIQVWNTRTHRLLAARLDPGTTAGPAYAPDGALLAYATDVPGLGIPASEVLLLNPRTLKVIAALRSITALITSIAFSPDNHEIAASYSNGTVSIWDTRTRRLVRTIPAATPLGYTIAFSPDGQTLAAGGDDGTTRLFDVRTGTLIAELQGQANKIDQVAFSPDGQTLASASGDSTVVLWNLEPGRAVQALCQALRGPSLDRQWASLHAAIGPPPC
jgi:WD40 repeat protein